MPFSTNPSLRRNTRNIRLTYLVISLTILSIFGGFFYIIDDFTTSNQMTIEAEKRLEKQINLTLELLYESEKTKNTIDKSDFDFNFATFLKTAIDWQTSHESLVAITAASDELEKLELSHKAIEHNLESLKFLSPHSHIESKKSHTFSSHNASITRYLIEYRKELDIYWSRNFKALQRDGSLMRKKAAIVIGVLIFVLLLSFVAFLNPQFKRIHNTMHEIEVEYHELSKADFRKAEKLRDLNKFITRTHELNMLLRENETILNKKVEELNDSKETQAKIQQKVKELLEQAHRKNETLETALKNVKAAQKDVHKLSLVINRSSNAVLLTNEYRKIDWVNTTFERFINTGSAFGQTLDFEFFSNLFHHTEELETLQKLFSLEIESLNIEISRYNPQYTPQIEWYNLNAVVLWNENDEFAGFFFVLSDITEKKITQREMEALNLRLKNILDTLPIMFYIKDVDNKFVYVNTQVQNLLQKSSNQLVGKAFENPNTGYHHNLAAIFDTSTVSDVLQPLPQEEVSIELRGDGEKQHFLVGKKVLPSIEPNNDLVVGFAIDITEQIDSQNKLNRVVAMLQSSEKELRQNAEELLTFNDSLNDANKMLESTLVKEKASRNELEKAMSELKTAQSQLIQSEKMASLRQLTAGIAHEINNPVNFIYAGTGALERSLNSYIEVANFFLKLDTSSVMDKKLAESIQRIKQKFDPTKLQSEVVILVEDIKIGAQRTAEIVKGLRNFSRLDDDKLKRTYLNEILDSSLLLLKNTFRDKAVDLKKEYDGNPEISCYPNQLNQLFINLVINAIDATNGRENPTVVIKTKLHPNSINLVFSDNGCGIPKNIIQRLFEPFFTTKDVGEGTGLGLSISYGIVEKHNGRIQVESEEGKGTSFSIDLPLHPEQEIK